MTNIRITKLFRFEMAHALHAYDGKCAHIHGHSYQLSVTVIGKPITEKNNPKRGMVMDFGVLKACVNQTVVNELDHALLLSDQTERVSSTAHPLFQRVVYVPFQPTCENMLIDIAKKLQKALPETVQLHALKLVETPTSYAEWFASDNV